ncbi:MAG TPA: alpha/beta fold hydrolase [Pyrinomonadaceae bacterium]|nr:alpha/beta fold hydrolase [Pyrinomonadaceae bacterium]
MYSPINRDRSARGGLERRRACRVVALAAFVFSMSTPVIAQRPVVETKARQEQRIKELQIKPQGNSYTTIYYKSDGLNIEAYFYKPAGEGPFPLVIYNHGSRSGQEHTEIPWRIIANILVPQGYAVLVPERRGYGKSDGPTYDEEVQGDRGERMMKRFREEAGDILAALDYLKQHQREAGASANRLNPLPFKIDFKRVALMGWSHGGVTSILAASERHEFVALVDQAGGALTWNSSPVLRRELPDAAAKTKVPALCMDSENDATTEAARTVGEAIKNSGQWEKTIIYPPFTPTSNPSNVAPGHLIFGQGVSIWQDDLLAFLKPRL